MAQYRVGHISVENGSTQVVGDITFWTVEAQVGDTFFIPDDPQEVLYTVAAIVSDTELTLSTAYQGSDKTGSPYVISRDKTPNAGFHVIHKGDTGTGELVSANFKTLDTLVPNLEAVATDIETSVAEAEAAAAEAEASAVTAGGHATSASDSAGEAADSATAAAASATAAAGSATTASTQASNASTSATAAAGSASSAATSATAADASADAAAVSETNAETAEVGAEAAAAAALASANASQDSADAAADSATAAAGSASAASSSASSASTSASAAAGSASAASASATAAAGSATTASTQASNASTSATAAAGSASSAATSATEASASADDAHDSADAASASATAAAGSASAASASATAAAGSATTASTQASNASTSATAAAGSATAASGSATTAGSHASAAAGSASAAAASATAADASADDAADSAAAAAASAASIDVSTYTQRAAAETVTGSWTFDNTLFIDGWTTVTGGVTIEGPWAQFNLVGNDHSYSVTHDNANAYLGIWDQTASAWRLMVSDATGAVSMPTNIASSSTSTGTLVLGGGLGVAGAVHASSFTGSGSGLTALNASNLGSGTVPSGRLSGTYGINISGYLSYGTSLQHDGWHSSNGTARLYLAGGGATYIGGTTLYFQAQPSGNNVFQVDSSGNALFAGEVQTSSSVEATGWSGAYYSGLAGQFGVSGGKVYVHAYNGAATASGPMVVYASSIDLYADSGYITAYNGKRTLDVSDSYLRLNQAGHYTNGVYTPGNISSGASFYSHAVSGGGGTRYGSLSVTGSNNSWIGINFNSGNTDLMWNTDAQGAHRAGVGWLWSFTNGVLDTGTVPYARLSGVGSGATYNASATGSAANTLVLRDGSGYSELYYTRFTNPNNENPGISQVLTQNGSDNYMRKSSIAHLGASLTASAPANRAMGIRRRDDGSDYNVQTYWTGSYWRLYGYYGDSAHADTHVGYADSAGYASTGASSIYCSSFSNSGTGYIIFANGFKIMWGTLTTVGNNSYTVNFPTSFSSYSRVMCTGTVASGNRQDNGPGTVSSSTSSFVLYDCDDTSKTSQWLAVGY